MAKQNEVTVSTDDTNSTANTTGPAQARYEQLISDRQHFVQRGDECARLTLPTLFIKDQTSTSSMKINDPKQSLGARGVTTLAGKMLVSLFPMNTPFFKMNVDEIAMKLKGEGELITEVKKGLGTIERGVIREIENSGDATVHYEVLKHLIIVGNVLVYLGEEGIRLYDLNKFTVVRDPAGKVLEIVVCEETAPASLPDEAIAAYQQASAREGKTEDSPEKTVRVYTHITFKDKRVKWHQEIMGVQVEGSHSDVPEDGNPWLALRFIRVDGENYGRSYVEQYLGDLNSLEVLTTAVRDAAVSAAKVVWLVRPNGTTSPQTIAKAPNNSVRSGDANDVTVLRMDKGTDLRVAQEMINAIQQRLAFAFMINSDVVRDAERVTAEEIRFIAQELDDSLGGIYSVLSKEFQLPYVKRKIFLMRRQSRLPKLPDMVSPVIVTGFAALGRGHDRDKLARFVQSIVEMVGPEGLAQYINIGELIERLAVSDGIDTLELVISAEDRAAQQEQGMQQQMMQQLTPEMIKQLGPQVQKMMEGAPNGTPQAEPQ